MLLRAKNANRACELWAVSRRTPTDPDAPAPNAPAGPGTTRVPRRRRAAQPMTAGTRAPTATPVIAPRGCGHARMPAIPNASRATP